MRHSLGPVAIWAQYDSRRSVPLTELTPWFCAPFARTSMNDSMAVVYAPAFYNDYDLTVSPLFTRPVSQYEAANAVTSQPNGSGDPLHACTKRAEMPSQVMVSV